MTESNIILRDYKDSDYKDCEALANGAWQFDDNFKPQELSDIAKHICTTGALVASNFRKVIESNGEVIGFLFGFNNMSARPKKVMLFGLSTVFRMLCAKGIKFSEKITLLQAINTHEKNRLQVVDRGKSEILLFVVDPSHHGCGYGKRLLSEFTIRCKRSGAKSIIVDTNTLGASRFYENAGFKHIGDFHSPLHEYATKGGQACMYEYTHE
ncbi:GNAT family N-acetyltransferase [bacterium AH-315-I20]|nr:GNAT family N-acetyltransferase [bacterium AH-315-I20]MBN4060675.1 GNAT family N-acetyltransferase [bacterium AH-315-I20]